MSTLDTARRNTPPYLIEEAVAENRVSMNEIRPAISGALLHHKNHVEDKIPKLSAGVL